MDGRYVQGHEWLVCVRRSDFDAIGRWRGFAPECGAWVGNLLRPGCVRFILRTEALEADESLLQLVAYVILRSRGLVLHYNRGAIDGDPRLSSRFSIGVGGHVTKADAEADHGGYLDACRFAALREVAEETGGLAPIESVSCAGMVFDDSDAVGRVHLGIVYHVDLAEPRGGVRGAGVVDRGWAEIGRDLRPEFVGWESWSRLIIQYCCDRMKP